MIFSKLRMIEMLYSLLNVNQRFDRLVLDPFYVRHLDLTIPSLFNQDSPINNEIFDRIRTRILPDIQHQVNKITVEPCSMKCILDNTIDYPNLTSLSLVNFQSRTLFDQLLGIVVNVLFFNQLLKFCFVYFR